MGTSNKYGGPKGGNPLIPSWLGDAGSPPEPSPPEPTPPPKKPEEPPQTPPKPDKPSSPGAPPPPPPKPSKGLTSPRKAFNSYARGNGDNYLRRALSGYVSKGAGGSRSATTRMGPSRRAASNLYGFIQDVGARGVQAALASFNRDDLFGKSPEDIFGALTDAICPNGGLIDDAIAREAWNEAALAVIEQGVEDIATMSQDQWDAVFSDFIARSIEMRVFNDICADGISLPETLADVNQVQADLHSLISEAVSDTIGETFERGGQLDENQIRSAVDDIYNRAFGYLSALGEE